MKLSLVRDSAAIVLLLLGLRIYGVGWLVGVGLLWSSPTWGLRDKLLGTFVIPGGLVFGVLIAMFGFPVTAWPTGILGWAFIFAPLYTTGHLTRRLIRVRRSARLAH
jgi:hypothetical protein